MITMLVLSEDINVCIVRSYQCWYYQDISEDNNVGIIRRYQRITMLILLEDNYQYQPEYY